MYFLWIHYTKYSATKKEIKKCIKIFEFSTYLCRLSNCVENAIFPVRLSFHIGIMLGMLTSIAHVIERECSIQIHQNELHLIHRFLDVIDSDEQVVICNQCSKYKWTGNMRNLNVILLQTGDGKSKTN